MSANILIGGQSHKRHGSELRPVTCLPLVEGATTNVLDMARELSRIAGVDTVSIAVYDDGLMGEDFFGRAMRWEWRKPANDKRRKR